MKASTWILAFPLVHHIFINMILDLTVEQNEIRSAYIDGLFQDELKITVQNNTSYTCNTHLTHFPIVDIVKLVKPWPVLGLGLQTLPFTLGNCIRRPAQLVTL